MHVLCVQKCGFLCRVQCEFLHPVSLHPGSHTAAPQGKPTPCSLLLPQCHPAAPGTIIGLDPTSGSSSLPGTTSLQSTQSLYSITLPAGQPQLPERFAVSFTIASTGAHFMFNNYNYTYNEAEQECQAQGGHLASYETVQEQLDVEAFLISNVSGD
jgi:hypothetical protein